VPVKRGQARGLDYLPLKHDHAIARYALILAAADYSPLSPENQAELAALEKLV
jgi:hypothetical protein